MKTAYRTLLPLALLLTAPVAAQAHPGHGPYNFADGFVHPFSGIDHLLAMLAVGLWAARLGGRALWSMPLVFVAMLAAGAAAAVAGLPLPLVEGGIATSLVVFGAALSFSRPLGLKSSLVLVGLFAVFHGYAHGQEMPDTASGLLYGCGFILASLSLQATGILVGLRSADRSRLIRAAGIAIAGTGVLLLIGV